MRDIRHRVAAQAGTCLAFVLALTGSGRFALAAGGDGDAGGEDDCLAGKLELLETVEPSAAFDAETGRDLRHFPPDRVVDLLHMKLQMRFDDLAQRQFSAVETLSFAPIGRPAEALTLDAVGLDIKSVTLDGKPVEHSQDDEQITLRFDPPLPAEKPVQVVFEYECRQPIAGMIFTPPSPDAPNYSPEVHTQGQTEQNRNWFISHDFPNERLTTELIVDVPAGLSACSNGRLVSHTVTGDRATWHYSQDQPHVSYLVALVIGSFDVVPIPHPRVPIQVWVPRGLADRVLPSYGRTGEMIDLFERRFGHPYPWAKYDQILVKNFGAGGMENTSATTLYPTALLDATALADRDLDGLISHELCHQWTGDMITCKSWAHIWLNEGWASYGSALWMEQRDGIDGYLDSIRGAFEVANRDKTTNDLPMVSPVYKDSWETFRRAANPYPKGSSILHMLRMMLGEEVFWKGVRLYMNRYAGGVVETDDFRYAMEEVSGLGLEWFFQQWCYRPGTPELAVSVRYDGKTRGLTIEIEQKQKIDERTPAFRFTLPIVARTASGDHEYSIDVTEKSTHFNTTLDGVPQIVAIDPSLHVLKTITEVKPQAMWMAQAAGGPTIAARHDAIEALGKIDSPEAIDLLATIIKDESQRYSVRNTAIRSMAGYESPEAKAALAAIFKAGIAEPRVRVVLVGKLRGALDKKEAIELLADVAGHDSSYATREAAIDGLAALDAKDKGDLIVELVGFPSQGDDIRQAALKALAKFDDARGLDLAIQYAAYGNMDRSRPTAIEAIGKLAGHDKDRAVEFLLTLLDDPETRSVRAAASALAETGDKRAEDPLKKLSESHRDKRFREDIAKDLAKLREKLKT